MRRGPRPEQIVAAGTVEVSPAPRIAPVAAAQEAVPESALRVRAGVLPPGSGNRVPASGGDLSAQDRLKELRGRHVTGFEFGGQAAVLSQPAVGNPPRARRGRKFYRQLSVFCTDLEGALESLAELGGIKPC